MKMVPCVILYYNFHPSHRICRRVIYVQAELFFCRSRNLNCRKSFTITASPQGDMSFMELFGFCFVFTDFGLIWACRNYFYRKKKVGLKREGCGFSALLTAPALQKRHGWVTLTYVCTQMLQSYLHYLQMQKNKSCSNYIWSGCILSQEQKTRRMIQIQIICNLTIHYSFVIKHILSHSKYVSANISTTFKILLPS